MVKEGVIMCIFNQNELDDFIFERLIELGYAPTEEEVFTISDIFIEFLKENGAIILDAEDGQQPNN